MKDIIMEWFRNDIPSTFPAWAAEDSLYSGKYVSPGGHQTSYLARVSVSGMPQPSGKLRVAFAKALCRAQMVITGCEKDGFGVNSKAGIAEYTITDVYTGATVGPGECACVAYDRSKGKFYTQMSGTAMTFVSVKQPNGKPNAKARQNEVAPLIFAMLAVMMETTEFKAKFDEFITTQDVDIKRSNACWMCDYFYENIKNGNLPLCDVSELELLSNVRLRSPVYAPDTYFGGFSRFAKSSSGTAKRKTGLSRRTKMKTSKFNGAFSFRTEPLTPEQEARVPKLGDEYVVSKDLLLLCEHIQKSTGRRRPIRNILLRGEPGVGKSEMYVGIAAGCHLPLYSFAANSMTEPFDMFGQFIPVDDNGNQTGEKLPLNKVLSGMPSATDISMDPAFAYQRITGIAKQDATPMECMAAMFSVAQKSLDTNGGQQRFKFAPGQLIYALRDGGVWGLDEVTLPQNPGVIPALNPAMDSTQSITLPTGEVIHRHPDCIIVGTTNVDLEGCRQLNQAWMDRCQLIIELPEPSDEVLVARVKAMVDWREDEDASIVDLDVFLNAYHALKELAKKNHISSGVIGPRKLADWVMSTLITGDPILSANMTIVTGGSTDPQEMDEFKQKLRDLFR